jgi:hypothetical protein
MPSAPFRFHPGPLLLGLAWIAIAPAGAAAEVEIEVIEVPASEAVAAAAAEDGPRPLTLTERYDRSGIGTRYLTRAEEPGIAPEAGLTLYECRELLASEPGPPERTALVVELDRSRAYLLVSGRMLLETPVFLQVPEESVPAGWYPVTRRMLDAAPVKLESPQPTYWLELGSDAISLHAGLVAAEAAMPPVRSVRLPRAAMASVFRHLQPGSMVYLCRSWLDSEETLPVRIAHQGFLPDSASLPPARPAPPRRAEPPSPPAEVQAPFVQAPAEERPTPLLPETADGRKRVLIPVSADAARPPGESPRAGTVPPAPPAPADAPAEEAAVPAEEPPTPPASGPRPPRLRDLWGTKAEPVPTGAGKAKAEPAWAAPARLRDLWKPNPGNRSER